MESNASPPPSSPDDGDDSKVPPSLMAIRDWPAVVAFALVTVGGLAADLWSKHAVFAWLLSDPAVAEQVEASRLEEMVLRERPGQIPATAAIREYLSIERPVLGKMRFRVAMNSGVVFGWPMPPAVVGVVSIVTIGLVFLFFAVGDRRAWSMHIGLSCIMAGALGNLYDRLFGAVHIPGFAEPITNQVRDFVDLSGFQIAGWSYGYIFNIADVLLVVGVGLLIVNWWTFRKHIAKQRKRRRGEVGTRGRGEVAP